MTKRLIEIPLDDHGGVVVAEIEEDDPGFVRAATRTPEELADKLGGSVASALETVIRPTAQVVVGGLRAMRPDGIEVEFGLRLVGKAGAVFASSELEGHLKVKLTWAASPSVT